MKRVRNSIIIILSAICLIAASKSDDDYFEISKNLRIMASVYDKLNSNYVDELFPGKIMKTGINAMLKSLDPYTVYISESEIEDFRFATTGEYGGIGATIKIKEQRVLVTELYENSPATTSDLRVGDQLISIDGITLENLSIDEIGTLLKGAAESEIVLSIVRENQDIDIKIVRKDIQIPAVSFSKKIAKNIGIIKLTSFTQTSYSEFKKALTALQKNDVDKLIIDLRSNGGGLLNEAVKIVNLFIDKGQKVVSTKSRIKEMNRTYITQELPIAKDMSVVVLVDEMSASASEIVAGSLQDLDRGVVVGNTSFGKGLVQQTKPVSFGGQIKLTVAKYYTPSGRCIQKVDYSEGKKSIAIADSLVKEFKTQNGRTVTDSRGIEPDIMVKSSYYNSLTEKLLFDDYISDFTNVEIKNIKDSIDPSTYVLSEDAYSRFSQFVLDQDVKYTTESYQLLESLKESAVREDRFNENIKTFIDLDSIFSANISRDLKKYKDEISFFIENEIISRTHYQSGRIEASLKYDSCVTKALEVLNADSLYYHILGY
ncbi:MAG: peptidase S41 [Crocinitomicaceae bacterium]|nr:MAG: peptidase S41 [Crocinitomicaceae bacterium]